MVEPATAPRLNSFYIFKFSNQQSMADSQPRWTEIEHLPEWDEEFYHIYTAKEIRQMGNDEDTTARTCR